MPIISRRRFLQLSTSSLLIASASPVWSMPRSDKPVGVALLGLGNYSASMLAPALQHTKHCRLTGIVTGTPDKIPQWQQKYGLQDANCYTYDNMDDIANNDDIDVIYIVTPTGTHMDFAVRAANTGKHVWCEKPMAMDEAQCQRIIDACEKNGVMLSVGYRMQHEPNTRTFADYQHTLPYGEMRKLSSFAGYGGNGRPADNWRMQKEMGGGALYDMGVYAINGARFITGKEPVAVTGRHEKSHPEIFKEVDETTFFTLEFADGPETECGTSVVKSFNHLKAECTDGWYQLKPMQSYSGVTGTTSDGKQLPPIKGMQQSLQMDNDALAIRNKGPLLVPAEEGLRDIRLVNAIFKAAKTGQKVTL
ncbi:Gfo/Idh/MocA family protein [Salinimonas lutimaris]|uniref:Gfo/Idh/MocA family protein n=1 Tax=Salinimonas lutimaris TaxID=914153 RepID=UPI0010BF8ABF|nr:Gfo/Idh/MocA family oxidoreductase [Salinimonas lutimaris]